MKFTYTHIIGVMSVHNLCLAMLSDNRCDCQERNRMAFVANDSARFEAEARGSLSYCKCDGRKRNGIGFVMF